MRLLAAIMFADMVGYTKMMQENEVKAKKLRDRQRAVLDKAIIEHRGQVMQYYGDGTLSMFGSALEAVKCAQEVQLELQNTPEVPLRIGIHIGDVVYDDEGVYGDAVNIAARVQALAVPGGVMISEKVFNEIKNQPGIRVESFGDHELKNVFDPVGIYALANEGLVVPAQEHVQQITGSRKNSVAVLPFVNMTSDKENEYFSDGITEEIINALTKVDGLYIPARTSVFAYKNKNKDIRKIGRDLKVYHVLEGSVRRSGNRVRVTAQLINTDDGFHLWSEVYDREMKDIFEVQDEIAQQIAEKLEENFTYNNTKRLYEASTDSIEGYNHYLQGLYYWNKWTPEDIFKAIDHYNKAIEACSTYTKAFSGLANCYTYLGTIGHLPPKEAYSKAEKNALRAIEINDTLADSFTALGSVNLFYKWDFKKAEANLRKAITLEPENAHARQSLGLFNRIVGRFDKMVQQYEMAVRIEPLSLIANLDLAHAYGVIAKYRKALERYDKILDLDPNFRAALEGKALLLVRMGKTDEALEMMKKYINLVDSPYGAGAQLGYVYAILGEENKARKTLENLKRRQESQPQLNLSLDFAVVYAALGEKDKAFEYIFKAVDDRLGCVLLLNTLAPLDILKEDDRFDVLIRKIGLPVESILVN